MSVAALIIVGERPDRAGELAAVLGGEVSERLAAALLDRAANWARVCAPGAAYICHPAATSPPSVGDGVETFSEDDDLLPNAVERVLVAHPGAELLIAGTTVPTLGSAHAAGALDDLGAGCDVSIGPATDGGWYLLGLTRCHADLLRASTFGEAIAAIGAGGLRIGMLRSERVLTGAADLRALVADPIAPPEITALV